MAANPIPDRHQNVIPNLIVHGADRLMTFLKDVFDAREDMCFRSPDGVVAHAQVFVGDTMLMLAEASEQFPAIASVLYVYVPDVDATYGRALRAGATSFRAPTDEFYGDRSGAVVDPTGNQWWIATHVEDVPPEEMKRREAAFYEQMKQGAEAAQPAA